MPGDIDGPKLVKVREEEMGKFKLEENKPPPPPAMLKGGGLAIPVFDGWIRFSFWRLRKDI
jgi:hypothetical protein